MSFKDKPKREGTRSFDRDRKSTSAPKKTPSRSAPDGEPRAARKPAPVATDGAASASAKPERISKILARAGIASRRDVERMIMEGRVSVNGKQLETPVLNATLADRIEVDGQPIRGIERTRLWLYHKPAGLVTTNSDPEGRPTVFDNLPEDLPRVMSIGRLDINTEGLLLLTNDGGLSRVLELPTTGWLRRYRVRAYGDISQEKLDTLKDGIAVDGVLYGAIDATLDRTQGHNVWITMGLREGKNREIKNVLGALGLEVNRLIRLSYGPFQLGDLPEGQVVEVRGRMLRDQLGPRLIEESKANFDAPIYSNNGPIEEDVATARSAEKPLGKPFGKQGDREERGFAVERRERSEAAGEGKRPAFSKPSGKPAGKFDKGGAKFGGKFDRAPAFDEDKPKKRPPLGTSRTANVWMAPGARPTADQKGKSSARAEAERLFAKGTDDASLRVQVNRVQGDSDWIRADEPPAGGRGDRSGGRGEGRGDRGDRGDRPARGDRPPRGDRPARGEGGERNFSDRPRGARPAGDRPSGDRPRGDRSFGDRKPREEGGRSKPYGAGAGPGRSPRENAERAFRPSGPRSEGRFEGGRSEGDRAEGGRGGFGGKPGGARPYSGRPAGERSEGGRGGFGDRPAGGKPFGGKPGGAKPFGGKPGGGKSFGGKPGGAKPFGGKPSGGKPSGGRGPGSGPKGGGNRSRTPRG
ncbi:23S rRNA pseudouridine2605 synthase [Neorhizobium galegae]|uniref:pseudouridine synthase n=1 Tax=Neorhizobium galegae TaxID=399 RepID=UPI001AE292B0|nr:pseudouridine synthase [Neorhizobium galegae]MBP2547863.1 23S rRNA pseudouridine2605 synthase [Neorhizobium galegae]